MIATPDGHAAHAQPGHSNGRPEVERLAFRLDEVANALGVSRRLLERERAAGRFPQADLYIGRIPLFKPEAIRAWIDHQGKDGRR
jgi:hypothetical protein